MPDDTEPAPTEQSTATATAEPPKAVAPAKKPKQRKPPFRKRHRWLMRFAVAAVVLLLIVAGVLVAVQLVLTSSYPKSIAESIASKQLGLDVKLGKLDIPWFGPIAIRDISVSLPLEQKPFITVPAAYAEHSFLPVLAANFLISGDPGLSLVGVRDPRVEVLQGKDGQWNVLRAVQAVLAAQNKGRSTGGGGLPPLPAIKLVGGTVHVRSNALDEAGKPVETTIDNLEVNAEPDGPLRYTLGAGVVDPAGVKNPVDVHVALVPRDDFAHEVSFDVEQIKPYLAPFIPAFPEPVVLRGRWEGRVEGGGVSGRLDLDTLQVDQQFARGSLDLTAGADGATGTIRTFAIDAGTLVPRPVRVTGGTIKLTPEQATAEGMRAELLNGFATVPSAKFVYAALAGEVAVDYKELAPLPGYSLNGHLDARAFRDKFNQYEVGAKLHGVSGVPGGTVTTNLTLDGDGPDPGHLDLQAVVKQALFKENAPAPSAAKNAAASTEVPNRVTTQPVAPSTFPAAAPATLPTPPATLPTFAPPPQLAAATAAAESYNLPQITAVIRTRFDARQSLVALDSLEADDPSQLHGRGEYDFGWHPPTPGELKGPRGYLWAEARGVPVAVPRVKNLTVALDAGVNAWVAPFETRDHKFGPLLTVKQFYASTGGLVVSGEGAYSSADPVPVHLVASILRAPDKARDEALSDYIRGDLRAVATVDGLVAPLKLDVKVDVKADSLTLLNKYNITNFKLLLDGSADGDQFRLHSQTFELFGGNITLGGTYPYRSTDAFVATADVQRLNLRQIGDLLRLDLDGTANGTVRLRATDIALDKIKVDALFDAADIVLSFKDYRLKLADAAHLEARLNGGKVRVDPLVTNGGGSLTASAYADLDDLSRVKLSAHIKQFPLEAKGLPVSIIADGNADDLTAKLGGQPELNGSANFGVRVNVANVMDLADAELKLTAAGRAAVLDRLDVTSKIGGEITGNGRFDLDNPLAATLNISWDGLDGKRLADLTSPTFPITDGLTGTHSGHLSLEPATGKNPLGPVRMELFDDTSGAWREIELGQSRLIFFYEPKPEAFYKPAKIVSGTPRLKIGPDGRSVKGPDGRPEFDDESIIRVAGGEVRPFVRLASQPGPLVPRSVSERGPDVLSGQVSATFGQLQIGAAARSVAPDNAQLGKVRGLLGGQVNLRANLDDPSKLFDLAALAKLNGSGRLELSDADLKGVGVLKTIVAGADEKEQKRKEETGKDEGYGADPNAAGRGTVRFQLEGDTLRVNSLDLFVSGIQIQGAPVVSGLSDYPKSELSGIVVAAARPLKNVKLPFFADADQILGAFQQSAATFRLKGTLEHLGVNSVEQASIAEAGDTLKELLTGEAAKKK